MTLKQFDWSAEGFVGSLLSPRGIIATASIYGCLVLAYVCFKLFHFEVADAFGFAIPVGGAVPGLLTFFLGLLVTSLLIDFIVHLVKPWQSSVMFLWWVIYFTVLGLLPAVVVTTIVFIFPLHALMFVSGSSGFPVFVIALIPSAIMVSGLSRSMGSSVCVPASSITVTVLFLAVLPAINWNQSAWLPWLVFFSEALFTPLILTFLIDGRLSRRLRADSSRSGQPTTPSPWSPKVTVDQPSSTAIQLPPLVGYPLQAAQERVTPSHGWPGIVCPICGTHVQYVAPYRQYYCTNCHMYV